MQPAYDRIFGGDAKNAIAFLMECFDLGLNIILKSASDWSTIKSTNVSYTEYSRVHSRHRIRSNLHPADL